MNRIKIPSTGTNWFTLCSTRRGCIPLPRFFSVAIAIQDVVPTIPDAMTFIIEVQPSTLGGLFLFVQQKYKHLESEIVGRNEDKGIILLFCLFACAQLTIIENTRGFSPRIWLWHKLHTVCPRVTKTSLFEIWKTTNFQQCFSRPHLHTNFEKKTKKKHVI